MSKNLRISELFAIFAYGNIDLKPFDIMPIIIGYMFGKMLGNLIVAIVSLMFRLLHLAGVVLFHVVKYTFIALRWLLGKLYEGGRDLYMDYKLNYK